MARRMDDVVSEADVSPEQWARWQSELEAYGRGELPVVTLEEFQPLLSSWIDECEELTRQREAAGIPDGVDWAPPGGLRDWGAEMAALPWRTRKQREQDGEQW